MAQDSTAGTSVELWENSWHYLQNSSFFLLVWNVTWQHSTSNSMLMILVIVYELMRMELCKRTWLMRSAPSSRTSCTGSPQLMIPRPSIPWKRKLKSQYFETDARQNQVKGLALRCSLFIMFTCRTSSEAPKAGLTSFSRACKKSFRTTTSFSAASGSICTFWSAFTNLMGYWERR